MVQQQLDISLDSPLFIIDVVAKTRSVNNGEWNSKLPDMESNW